MLTSKELKSEKEVYPLPKSSSKIETPSFFKYETFACSISFSSLDKFLSSKISTATAEWLIPYIYNIFSKGRLTKC